MPMVEFWVAQYWLTAYWVMSVMQAVCCVASRIAVPMPCTTTYGRMSMTNASARVNQGVYSCVGRVRIAGPGGGGA